MAHYSGLRRSRCSIPKVIGFNFEHLSLSMGTGAETLSSFVAVRRPYLFLPQSFQPTNSGRSLCRRIASQNRSTYEDGAQHQRSRIIGLGLAALRAQSHTGFNLAHLARGCRTSSRRGPRKPSGERQPQARHLRRLGCRISLRVPLFPKNARFSGPSQLAATYSGPWLPKLTRSS
jgi:hypothetical protein